jgi:uncharacterized membrane protein YhaH (DUF805 family)
MDRGRAFGFWLVSMAVLVAAGVIVPYGLLAGRAGWAVSVVWLAFGIAVAVLVAVAIRRWRDA